jgi:4-amino-4-deoxy-L-arabinose transferase-like glycosyltransferase
MLVLLLAFAAWVQLSVVRHTEVIAPLRADAAEYFSYAWNLEHNGNYSRVATWLYPEQQPVPDALRTPGYPLFLRFATRPEVSAGWLKRVATWQAVMGVFSVLLTWLLARRMVRAELAWIAAFLVAIDPWIVTTSVFVLSESLYTLLLLGCVLLTLLAGRAKKGLGAMALVTGLAWGACALVRPATLYLPMLFLLATLLLPSLARWRKAALLGLLGFSIAWAPWMLRNQDPELARTSGHLMIASLAHGSYPDFRYEDRPESEGFPYRFDPLYPQSVRSLSSVLGYIGARARTEPLRYARWYLLGKPYFFLSQRDEQQLGMAIYPLARTPWYYDFRFHLMAVVSSVLHWPLMLLGLCAIVLLAFRAGLLGLAPEQLAAARLVASVVAYAVAVHMIVAPFPRYGVPFRPLLFMLAMVSLAAAWRHLRRPRPASALVA